MFYQSGIRAGEVEASSFAPTTDEHHERRDSFQRQRKGGVVDVADAHTRQLLRVGDAYAM
jgi:hypothetical protein